MSVIKPIEEVMEEDSLSRQHNSSNTSISSALSTVVAAEGGANSGSSRAESTSMDVDDGTAAPGEGGHSSQEQQQQRTAHAFAARLGHAGLSPLVLGDVANPSQEYLARLLPFNNSLGGQSHVQQAAALVAAAAAIQVCGYLVPIDLS